MSKKSNIHEDNLFNQIKEEEIQFPIYYANKSRTTYTCLFTEDKFEELSISRINESFRGNILFGFNELYKDICNDKKIFYHSIIRLNDLITKEEYDEVFDKIMSGRLEFFTGESHKYIERPIDQERLNKHIKHRWKPA